MLMVFYYLLSNSFYFCIPSYLLVLQLLLEHLHLGLLAEVLHLLEPARLHAVGERPADHTMMAKAETEQQ